METKPYEIVAAPATPSCSTNAENRTRQPERVDEIAKREHDTNRPGAMTNPDAVVVGYYAGRLTVQLVGKPASVLPIGAGLWLSPPGEDATQRVRAADRARRKE